MRDLGDRTEDSTIDFTFHTTNESAAPTTLAGTPAISVYKANGTTQSTAGVTLTVDFDTVTGLNHVRIDTSADAFYAVANDYSVVITTGTVNSISVVGATVATFSIENRLTKDIYSDTTIIASDVVLIYSDTAAIHSQTTVIESDSIVIESDTAAIESELIEVHSDTTIIESDTFAIHSDTTIIASDLVQVYSDTTVIESDVARLEQGLIVATGALEATPSSTVLQTDLAEASDDHYNNMVFMMTSGNEAGESRRISDYTGATGTVTLDTALTGAPTATETFVIINAVSSGGALTAAQASDLVAIESELILVHSETTVIQSDTTAIHSQTTVIESDTAVIESDTTAIHSDTTIIASDVVQIYSDTTVIASDVVLVYSDTTAIHSDTTIIASDVVLIYSDTTVIASDVVLVYSDTTAIHSDTTIIASDAVLIYSDTAAIHSQTTVIESDVALLETSRGEPAQGAPGVSTSVLEKIDYLYKAWRNKSTQTSSTYSLFADDTTTVDHKATVSDDATTFTRGEVVTGP